MTETTSPTTYPILECKRTIRARLSEPRLHRQIRAIAAARAVPAREVDDVLQETLAQALVSTTLPEPAAAFGRYVRAIGRNLACKVAGQKRPMDVPFDEELWGARESGTDRHAEVRERVARTLRRAAVARDAMALEWIVRHDEGETFAEIARDTTLAADSVSRRVRRLRGVLGRGGG